MQIHMNPETIRFTIHDGDKRRITLDSCPEMSSGRKFIQKGLDVLRQHAVKTLRYLSRQKALSHLRQYDIELAHPAAMSATEATEVLHRYLQAKKKRRLLYCLVEIVLMPITGLMALLPGPNIFFYFLFVLFYFHGKAYLHLRGLQASGLRLRFLPQA